MKTDLRRKQIKFNAYYSVCSLVLLLGVLVGCKKDDGNSGGPPTPGNCHINFEKTVPLLQKQNGDTLWLSLKDLEFLEDPALLLTEVWLEVNLKSPRHDPLPVRLSINGLKVNRRDQQDLEESHDTHGAHKNMRRHEMRFPLHKMFLNGASSFSSFLIQVKKNRGILKISLIGVGRHISSAKLIFKGRLLRPCPSEPPKPSVTPTPGPTPSPAETRLEKVEPAQSPTGSSTMAFSFSSSQVGANFRCRLDGGVEEACSSPQVYSGLSDGAHLFEVWAVNSANLAGPSVKYSWVIDLVPPSVVISNQSTLSTLTAATDILLELSSDSAVSFECRLDEGVWLACPTRHTISALAEGLHQIEVRGVDSVGNKSETPARFAWRVDLTPPSVSFTSIVPGEAASSMTSREFSVALNEAGTLECSLDHNAYEPCQLAHRVGPLSDGSHSLEVRARDLVGHLSSVISHSWLVDSVAPAIRLLNVVPAAGLTNSQRISVDFELSEVGTVSCDWDGVPSACSSPWVIESLSEGSHHLVFQGRDLAGNLSQVLVLDWQVDLTAPAIAFGAILPTAARWVSSSSLQLSVVGTDGGELFYSLDGAPWQLSSSPLDLLNLTESPHNLKARVRDTAGNFSNELVHEFTVDLTPPRITVQPSNLGAILSWDHLEFELSSSEIVDFECNADSAGFAPCTSPWNLSGLADGNHEVLIRGKDLAGNESSTVAHKWTVDTLAPTSQITGRQLSDRVELEFDSNETPVQWICVQDGGAEFACSTPFVWSNPSDGPHEFWVTAVDLAGNRNSAGARFSFQKLPPISTTIVSVVPSSGLTHLRTLEVQMQGSRPPSGFLCSLDGAPRKSCLSPYLLTDLGEGLHSVRVWAVDELGLPDPIGAAYSWTIDTTAPTIQTRSSTTTRTSITVNWTTNEPSTSYLEYGAYPALDQRTAESSALSTSHSVTLEGLSANTIYNVQIRGRDQVGNPYSSPVLNIRTNR